MKQTAVEWLVEQLNEKIDFIPLDKWDMIRDIIQQAKAMEKQQKKNAYNSDRHLLSCYDDGSLFEQYYQETYGG
jgi:hypothetical protein